MRSGQLSVCSETPSTIGEVIEEEEIPQGEDFEALESLKKYDDDRWYQAKKMKKAAQKQNDLDLSATNSLTIIQSAGTFIQTISHLELKALFESDRSITGVSGGL